MSGETVPIVAHKGHLYVLTCNGVYDIATYEEEVENNCSCDDAGEWSGQPHRHMGFIDDEEKT